MIKKGLNFLKKNWYAAVVTAGSFFVGIEVLAPWAGYGVPTLCFAGWIIYKIAK